MHYTPLSETSFVSLPRDGGVAYSAQESWVQNETIRVSPARVAYRFSITESWHSRTTFSSGVRMTKNVTTKVSYLRHVIIESHSTNHPVIHQCALKRDLSLFEAGDQTEVGEKGLTLRSVQAFILISTQVLTRPPPQWRPKGNDL